MTRKNLEYYFSSSGRDLYLAKGVEFHNPISFDGLNCPSESVKDGYYKISAKSFGRLAHLEKRACKKLVEIAIENQANVVVLEDVKRGSEVEGNYPRRRQKSYFTEMEIGFYKIDNSSKNI